MLRHEKPLARAERLNAEIGKIVAKPAIREAWAKQGAVPMTMTPAAFSTFLQGDIDKWAKVVEKSGAWYIYNGDRLGQGKDNCREFLRENPAMAQEIEQKIRALIAAALDLPDDLTYPAGKEGRA